MFGFLVSRMLPIVPRGIVRKVASRYVAGEDLDAAVSAVAGLNRRGWLATLDILGEDAVDAGHAEATVAGYLGVLDAIGRHGLKSNVSVKLTHLGLRLDEAAARAGMDRIVADAAQRGSFARIDMEDSSLTDVTIATYRGLRERHGHAHVGTVLQAYLRRTADDAASIAAWGPCNLRLCKGIYREPAAIAFQKREEIRDSYLRTAEVLLRAPGAYVAFATHDRVLIERVRTLIAKLGAPNDRYEFQALLGVPIEDVLDGLVADGITVRVYVPFGGEWYPYSTRRLKENPKLATYVLKQMFHLGAG
jgi:proline dehydrogenase